MSLLWPQVVNHSKVLLLVTDACTNMVKAAKHLKLSYYRMIHMTYMQGRDFRVFIGGARIYIYTLKTHT